jgi:hypothetical protein
MNVANGSRLGPYDVVEALGAGGPAFARGEIGRELRRGLAIAQERTT